MKIPLIRFVINFRYSITITIMEATIARYGIELQMFIARHSDRWRICGYESFV